MGTVITLGRDRARVTAGDAEMAEARSAFERRHWIRLPRLVAGDILESVLDGVARGAFVEKVHGDVGVEDCLALESPVQHALSMLVNDEDLFGMVEALTGCARIGCFKGRVYRLMAGRSHHDDWHSDVADLRNLLAMSVNLSAAPYRGGKLLMRHAGSGELLAAVDNLGLGDAILFRLSPELQHRVTDVEGEVPKVAFAGWFRSGPGYRELLFRR